MRLVLDDHRPDESSRVRPDGTDRSAIIFSADQTMSSTAASDSAASSSSSSSWSCEQLCAALAAAGASVLPAAFLRAAIDHLAEQRVTGAELADVLGDDACVALYCLAPLISQYVVCVGVIACVAISRSLCSHVKQINFPVLSTCVSNIARAESASSER